MAVTRNEISYPVGDATIPSLFFLPDGHGPFSVVVIFHGSDGFQSNHADIAQKLAEAGFASFAMTWFGADPKRSHWDMLRHEDILAGVAWLKKEPAVDSKRLGLIGFSRGGGLALLMGALIPETRAVVNYFGLTSWQGGMQEFRHLPLNPSDHLEFVKNISCPILSFHGEKDTVVTVENTIQLDFACQKHGIDHTVILYPDLDHSFIWPGDKYNKKAHLDSWDKTIRFFKTHLSASE